MTAAGQRATTAVAVDEQGRFTWGNGVVSMTFQTSDDKPVTLVGLSGRGMSGSTTVVQRDPRPIVEVLATGTGSNDNRQPLIMTVAGSRLRFVGARIVTPEGGANAGDQPSHGEPIAPYRLEITQLAPYAALQPGGREFDNPAIDPTGGASSADATASTVPTVPTDDGLTVVSVFEAYPNMSAVRTFTTLHSPRRLPIEAVSSLNLTLPMDTGDATVDASRIFWGDAAWAVENDWHSAPLRDTAVRDRNQIINPGESSSRFVRSSSSTWSTGVHEPAGIIEARRDADETPAFSVMWQIEHNGPWEWEVGENDPGLHITAYGPEYRDHQWVTTLGSVADNGDGSHDVGTGNGNAGNDDDNADAVYNDVISVPVSFAVAAGDWQQATAEMTLQRRALRTAKAAQLGRSQQFEHTQGLVVYNDYMNTLFGDPRIEKELPLIEGAAKVGADIFCIDAGWYDSTDGGWWDMVGEWLPSTNRFGDAGMAGLARTIRDAGMGLGLWLEPEVIGVKSPLAATLPDDAFFTRHGVRVCDSGRYLLDFRSPAAREHVTRTVDRLIDEFDVKFFKFDYNTIPGVGTDRDAESAGAGLLDHCRAYLDWLDDLRRRHPEVMIENCGSGAMRADYAQLSRLDLQSTSDQCDPLIYAAIAAGAGLTILPEQQGNWGYAQQEMDDETAVLTLASGVLGRLYLSGFINRMDETRLALVRDAIALHRRILAEQQSLVPWWPAGLPDFNGDWLVAGLRPYAAAVTADEATVGTSYMTVWRRAGESSIDLPLPEGREITQIFPDPQSATNHAPNARPWTVTRLDAGTVRLTAADTANPSARIFVVR